VGLERGFFVADRTASEGTPDGSYRLSRQTGE